MPVKEQSVFENMPLPDFKSPLYKWYVGIFMATHLFGVAIIILMVSDFLRINGGNTRNGLIILFSLLGLSGIIVRKSLGWVLSAIFYIGFVGSIFALHIFVFKTHFLPGEIAVLVAFFIGIGLMHTKELRKFYKYPLAGKSKNLLLALAGACVFILFIVYPYFMGIYT